MNPLVGVRVLAGLFGPGGEPGRMGMGSVVGLGGLFGLFDLVEGDCVAECFELALEPAGAVLG